MSVKSDALKQIRLKPEIHEKLIDLQRSMWIKIPLWELANCAIDAGINKVRRAMKTKPSESQTNAKE